MVDQDIVENYQLDLLKGSDGDSAQRGMLMPSYAPLQSRLSGYKTYQEKTKFKEVDLPGYDLGEFYISVLNDRGPEPLTIDDIPRDSAYIRGTVMNLREHGQLGKTEPFLNEVQLYETQKDYRGTENIPTDRLRAEMFLSKTDYYKATLYVDDIGNSRTEQVNDFERRELIQKQQDQSRKRTILFEEEKTNYNTLAGAVNPRTTKDAVVQAVQKYSAISDQNTQDQKYQVKLKTYNEIHDDNINFQAVPDHSIPVADYSQVFIANASQMPLNYLYAFSKQSQRDREVFEAQQEEFNSLQKQQILQYVKRTQAPKDRKSSTQGHEKDQRAPDSLLGRIIHSINNKLDLNPKRVRRNEKEDKTIAKNFELLINVKKVKKDLCNTYYNRLQCVEDQLKVLNLDSNLIYKLPHQVDHKSLADLQVVEDFLVIAREAPKQTKLLLPKNNKYMQTQSYFEHCLNLLVEKYLSNHKQMPQHLLKQINSHYEQTQTLGRESFQGNKTQLQASLSKILSQFNPQNQQVIRDQKKQLLLQQKAADLANHRIKSQQNIHAFGKAQDPRLLQALKTPTFASHKKYTDLNPNSLDYNVRTGAIGTVSDNSVRRGLGDASVSTSRAPLNTDQNTRFSQHREQDHYEKMQGL